MSLLSAFSAARSSLAANAAQTALTSRNIANAGVDGAARKSALLVTNPGGSVTVAGVTRAADLALRRGALDATSAAATQSAIKAGYERLESVIGASGPIADQLSALESAVQQYASTPSNTSLGLAVLDSAQTLAGSLRDASAAVQDTRAGADADIAASVAHINQLLTEFASVDQAIVRGRQSGVDITDSLDRRDAILASLSEEIGIRTVAGSDGSTLVYTDSGAVLFDHGPRAVTFQQTDTFDATVAGKAVFVDGVDVTSANSTMRLAAGKIAGAATLRDTVTVQAQAQLDEVARSLIGVFAESDTGAPPTLPDIPGLFTYSGAPAMPGSTLVRGLAADIRVNPNADPAQGGDIARLRDGGIGDPGAPGYDGNPAGAASYATRLLQIVDALAGEQSFDPSAGLTARASVADYLSAAVGGFEGARQAASEASDRQGTLRDRAQAALSNATGVNLDDELAKMLDLEHSYQASAKLLSVVDGLIQSLIDSVR